MYSENGVCKISVIFYRPQSISLSIYRYGGDKVHENVQFH